MTIARFISKTMEEKKARDKNETNATTIAEDVVNKARAKTPPKENGINILSKASSILFT
jgi:hypothetical protein